MIKSAMRQALKESLLSRKQGSRNERAKAYTSDDENADRPSFQSKGLTPKVDDAEEDAMNELEQQSPSEYEGSPREEMEESPMEAKEEGDPGEYRDEDYWRDEQKDFMKGRNTAKKPKKAGSFIGKMVTGGGKKLTGKKIDPPFTPRSVKGQAQQTIG